MAAKLTISIDPGLLAWAQKRAKEQDTSVSAVVSDAMQMARQSEARERYLDWAGPVGELTPELEAERRAEIDGKAAPKKKRTAPAKKGR